ncbi:MAG: hypothetical protein VX278_05930 [Myxococcota bacterium]|nr:hypothetical protein [Myxococcota bacterium]
MKSIQMTMQHTLRIHLVVYALLLLFVSTPAFASDPPKAEVWLHKGSKVPLIVNDQAIPPLHTSKGPISPSCLGMMLGILPEQRDQMIGSVFIQDNKGRGCFRANDQEGIVRFDHVEYEVVEVEENNTYKLKFHALEWTGVAVEDFVIPTYKLMVRFERQPYTLEDNTVVQALVAVNLGKW